MIAISGWPEIFRARLGDGRLEPFMETEPAIWRRAPEQPQSTLHPQFL